ncbi:uncharacterized protein [Nicotiana sylvestris]|uniref:uncharacterized protein n=1 Tax=Nicotiana sylvestris TaxID=4096 RepID=UPI00388C8F64
MSRYVSLITDIKKVKIDCRWGKEVQVEIPSLEEDITTHKPGFLSLGEAVSMRPPPPSDKETQRPAKDKNRKEETLAESPKPKRARVLHAESAAALSVAKSEADAFLSSYRKDAAAANARAREISEEAELKMACALAHVQLEALKKAFKEVHANGFDLSAESKKRRPWKRRDMATMPKSTHQEEESPASASRLAGGTPSAFGELTWNCFISRRDFLMEKPLDILGHREHASREDDSILKARTKRPPETIEPGGLEAPNLEGEIPQLRKDGGPSLPDLAIGSRVSGSTLIGVGFGVSLPSQSTSDHSAGADDTELVDAKSTFEEAQRLCSMAFDKLKSELLHCEAKFHKALSGERSLRLLCDKETRELTHLRLELDRSRDYEETLECLRGEVSQVNSECNNLKSQIDIHTAAKRNVLAKASALEIQLRNAREGDSIQTSRITKLEIDLLKLMAEVVDARAEAEEVRAKADKKRETLEKINGKGFDLSEEIDQAKEDEFDAKFLISDDEDNKEGASEGAGPDGADGDTVPEGERLSSQR